MKPKGDGSLNAGYFVCNPSIFDFIGNGDDVVFEKEPLIIAKGGELYAYKHDGFYANGYSKRQDTSYECIIIKSAMDNLDS